VSPPVASLGRAQAPILIIVTGASSGFGRLTAQELATHGHVVYATMIDLSLEFDRVHTDDCEECESESKGMIERIRSEVTILGTFDEAQQARLAQIVTRCPVHKTLVRGVQIFD